MSFPTYPTYKDSGVEWLGEVPEHWVMGSLKNMAQIRNGRDYKEVESSDGEYPVIGSGGQFSNATQYLYEGESVLLGRKGTIDKPLYINGRFWTVDTMFYTEISKGACAKFFYYNSLTIPFGYYSTSTALPSMTQADLLNHPAAIPTKLEQTQIARFLDHETARIDALIEEQQRLIELLKEKRQAVISHAVTKGLDPTVSMKESGVEWLGEVPAHWNVGTLRWYATIQGGVAKGKDYEGRETVVMPYLRVANVQNGYVDLAEVKEIAVLESEVERYRLRAGDVLMNEGGDNDKLGRGTVWQAQIDPCLHQNHVFAIRPNGLLRAEWLAAFTQAEQARTYFYLNSKQSTNLASISASNVMSLALPIPSEKEQLEILTYLEADRSRHEELTAVAVSTVELLQERRSALISAAVTGKIDVRGWQPPVSTQAPELAVAEVV
ncbi:TPA: restriction endonuclease subunit S [Pseudomonas aeruginosa]|uniref:Restriction endonuclease subunit S n=1 Tax=Stutzerimonas azotifigens TaxID=291995 RepID=A0ABR5Z6E6_9GAMM|nr:MULTISPECIES: restriction endonuclease subunit S [Pseudomonadaceae]MBA1275783.1 restriction endonuclease subunit S [Stutzerimonas azotifigens]UCM26923.1 restriction endonuclease subunit S [Pseudomonas sp. PS1(2021)]HEK3711815.1 restriction endonuclease subunit S [Pseudomonas aeruginosa]